MFASFMHWRHHLSCNRHLLFFWWLSLELDDLPPIVKIAMGGQYNSCLLTVWITVVLFFFIEAIIFLWKVCWQSPHTLYLWLTLQLYAWTGLGTAELQKLQADALVVVPVLVGCWVRSTPTWPTRLSRLWDLWWDCGILGKGKEKNTVTVRHHRSAEKTQPVGPPQTAMDGRRRHITRQAYGTNLTSKCIDGD